MNSPEDSSSPLSLRSLALSSLDILLLDELTASLDKKSSELIEEYILSLKDKNTCDNGFHSLVQARKLGDRFISLREGGIKNVISQSDMPDGDDSDAALEARCRIKICLRKRW